VHDPVGIRIVHSRVEPGDQPAELQINLRTHR
jgi:hypothetical protein